jgi:ferredoxin-NADP reductase
MAFVRNNLSALGLQDDRIRYEFFGPAEALD